MSEEVVRDIQQMKKFEEAMENFRAKVEGMCERMESGIGGLSSFMEDPGTVRAMGKANKACQDIRAALNPTQMVLEKIKAAIDAAVAAEESGMEI